MKEWHWRAAILARECAALSARQSHLSVFTQGVRCNRTVFAMGEGRSTSVLASETEVWDASFLQRRTPRWWNRFCSERTRDQGLPARGHLLDRRLVEQVLRLNTESSVDFEALSA
jgi:hypothetical protein